MLTDYANTEKYFEGKPSSVSVIMTGNSKKNLNPITISIWPMVHETDDAEIEKSVRLINYSLIGYELTGAIAFKNISEGFTDFESLMGAISGVKSLFAQYEEETGYYFYMNNYAGKEWCKVELSEMFHNMKNNDD